METPTKNGSLVWEFFERLPSEKARCNTCQKELPCTSGNTSGLRRHLHSYHQNVAKVCSHSYHNHSNSSSRADGVILGVWEETASSLGKYHSLLSALGFEICWWKKWKASRSRLEFQDSKMKILDLVSNYEIQWWTISMSSRNMRFNDEKSRSRKSRSWTTW